MSHMDDTVDNIAKKVLHLDTLKTRGMDSLDFHKRSTWQLKKALEDAYNSGFARGASD